MKLLIKKKKNISELIIKKRDQLANYYKNYCFGQTKKQNLKILKKEKNKHFFGFLLGKIFI